MTASDLSIPCKAESILFLHGLCFPAPSVRPVHVENLEKDKIWG